MEKFEVGDVAQFPVFRMKDGKDYISDKTLDSNDNLTVGEVNTWIDYWTGLVANVDGIHVTVWYIDRADGNLKSRMFLEHQISHAKLKLF